MWLGRSARGDRQTGLRRSPVFQRHRSPSQLASTACDRRRDTGACDSVRFLLLLFDCSIWTGPSASSPRGDGRRNLRRSQETLKMRSMLGGSCFLDPFTFILNVRGKPITMHLYANLCGKLITIYIFLYSYAACSHVRTPLFILFYFPLSSFQTAFALPLQSITTTPG